LRSAKRRSKSVIPPAISRWCLARNRDVEQLRKYRIKSCSITFHELQCSNRILLVGALITGMLSLNPPNIMPEFISTSTSFQSKLSELSIMNSVPVKSTEALMSTCPEGDDADFFELPHWSEITAMTMMTTTIPRQPSVTRCVCRSSIVFATGCPQPGQATAWSDTFCLQAGHGIIGMSPALHSQFTRADLYMRDVFPFI
jgi:hypothetical protein